jgi:hypothetical protein
MASAPPALPLVLQEEKLQLLNITLFPKPDEKYTPPQLAAELL